MENEHKSSSLSDQVFEKLESDILSGKYPKDTLLTEMKLCAELQVSRTPVREALGRLKQERLVRETGKGAVVIGITTDDLKDIMMIRQRLEPTVAARCAKRITGEELSLLRETLDFQEFYLLKKDADRIKTMDTRFHEQIYRFSGSAVFFDVLSPLHNKVQRYRKAALENSGRAEKSVEEHRRIFAALETHDEESAFARMQEHVDNAMKSVIGIK